MLYLTQAYFKDTWLKPYITKIKQVVAIAATLQGHHVYTVYKVVRQLLDKRTLSNLSKIRRGIVFDVYKTLRQAHSKYI